MKQGDQIVLYKKEQYETSYIFGKLLAITPKHTILEYEDTEHVLSNSKWGKLADDVSEVALSLSKHTNSKLGKHHVSIAEAILKGEIEGISYERAS